ncbi:MAG: galactosyldiacylglycerol synthase [Bryobacteraceae bacterium]|nr:galactosyldiacylglycerol synthase [Bryobacteraceae bacterium]MDW8377852.1 glycosyltransferase [Bryobacterales bacterium]
MKHLDFVFFDAGGGHRAAANALQALIQRRAYPWQIRLVNLQEVLDELDICRKYFGIRMQDVYNQILKRGWTIGSAQGVALMHWLIRHYHADQVRVLANFWRQMEPDLVVSLIPNFGRALYESLKQVWPKTPLVTILTDLADYPPHFWIEPGQDQYYICGTEKAYQQAREFGYSEERAIRVSGMVLHPRFYERPPIDRATERQKLGLDPDLPTGLILFGGQGSSLIRLILKRLEKSARRAQYIAICGKNESLRDQLRRTRWSFPLFVEGFTSEVPYYMRLSDFFIGKPGPGSISEALVMGLPVILERNAWTLPQERYNTEWIQEKGAGIVLRNFRHIAAAVETLLAPGAFERYQQAVAKLDNQAVFEIPPILERLLKS